MRVKTVRIPEPTQGIIFLNELITTMEKVIAYNKKQTDINNKAHFLMDDFFDVYEDQVNHFCGTVACILGYQAIEENPNIIALGELQMRADRLAAKSVDLLGKNLGTSIYDSSAGNRRYHSPHRQDFVHLQSDETTPEDAIEYMEYVITLCEDQL